MKLLGITIGTLVICGLLYSTLYFWGQGLDYEAYDHPLMKIQATQVSFSTDNLNKAKEFLEKNPESGLHVKLRMSADGVFFTAPAKSLTFIHELPQKEPDHYKGNKHYYYSFEFLSSKSNEIIKLDDWAQLKPKFWILDLQDNALEIDKFFVKWVEKNNFQDKSIIRSDIDLIVTSLKEKQPTWIYGSTLSDLNKMLTLGGIHLEGIANFQRDYYFSPLKINDRDMINEDVLIEIRKRRKGIALGPVHTDVDRERAMQLKPEILIIQDSATD